MPQYYYVVDTSITNDAGVAVGQTTYDLLVDERLNHGVIGVTTGIGGGSTWVYTDSPPGTQIGIHTTQKCRYWWNSSSMIFNLKVHGNIDASIVGFASVGVATLVSQHLVEHMTQ